MLKKFADAGLAGPEVERWIEELEDGGAPERVSYGRIRPILLYFYEEGKAKRIPSWRAEKIRENCDAFIKSASWLPVASLPSHHRRKWFGWLLVALASHLARRFSTKEGKVLEKRVLAPSHSLEDYRKPSGGRTQIDRAFSALGMRKKAFDLMVAENTEIFSRAGMYAKRWYLPDLYLRELSEKAYFKLISVKYELLARQLSRGEANDKRVQ